MTTELRRDGHKFIPIEIEENNIYPGVLKILHEIRPEWPEDKINFKLFTDGITNKLVACEIRDKTDKRDNIVLVRIYGNKTDLLIDRTAEVRNITRLHSLNLAPEIYGVFKNGLAYEYYPGMTLTVDSVTDVKIAALVAKQMAKMHKVELNTDIKKEPMVWDKIDQFLCLVPEPFTDPTKQTRFANRFGTIARLRIEFERLKSHLIKTESPIVFAHNDLLLGNVIHNQCNGTVSFIDYEYAAYNYQAFDIANHFNEFVGLSLDDIDNNRYPNKEFQMFWIETYLNEYLDTSDEDVIKSKAEDIYIEVQKLSLASHFMWGIWSLVQFEHSSIDFDFGRYADIRLSRYFELKDTMRLI